MKYTKQTLSSQRYYEHIVHSDLVCNFQGRDFKSCLQVLPIHQILEGSDILN